MQEISKLRINEKTYKIKDEEARKNSGKNFIVNTTSNPIYPDQFICDYSYDEIRNALISEKNVVMYFEDTIEQSGNQVYPFLKLTKDGAYFRRVQVTKNHVRQIDIKVDNGKNVTFKEIFYNVSDELNKKENFETVSKTLDTSSINDVSSFRTFFYNLRKSNNRKYQFEIQEGVNENIVSGVGGLPNGLTLKDKAFLYIDIPYSEAGGFLINIIYEGRTSGKLYKKSMFSTLDSNWKETTWLSTEELNGQFSSLNDEVNLLTAEVSEIKQNLDNKSNSYFAGNNPDINSSQFRSISGSYGIYGCDQTPSTSIGVLTVYSYSPQWVIQEWREPNKGVWTRSFTSGTSWSGWSKIG